MHPRNRRRKLRKAAQDLHLVLRGLPAAEDAWELLAPGLKAQTLDPSGRRAVDADPTGWSGSAPSAARTAEVELDGALERLEHEAVRAAAIVRRIAEGVTHGLTREAAGNDIGS